MQKPQISIHPLSDNPTAAWKEISRNQTIFKVNLETPAKPAAENQVRFVCMSDTHSMVDKIKFRVPDGDVFIYAGDFTKYGHCKEVKTFDKWLGTLPHRHKIVICGNHEVSFDPRFISAFKDKYEHHSRHNGRLSFIFCCSNYYHNVNEWTINSVNIEQYLTKGDIRKYLTNCIYLEDSFTVLYGIKIYGSPWQPAYGTCAFNLRRGEECLEKWNLIPDDTDILVTHTPPLGHGDLAGPFTRTGCVELLSTVQKRVQPTHHIFGHIHEGYGVTSDGRTMYINASTCDIEHMPNNEPIVFDIPLPPGQKKS